MAANSDTVTCKLFLGFGGSGAKTLLELARMFAADREWSRRCESEAYFLLADTDADDLYGYEQQIRSTLAHVGAHTWVKSVQLSQGVPRMDRLITDRLERARANPTAHKRIKDVWWFDDKDEPFIARNVPLSPSEGAGQCPAISYFLAWNAIGGDSSPIGRTVEEMCNEMQTRIAAYKGARDFDVRFYFVAGLAGGTGRGSWAPLSFKIQQALRARGKVAFPIGVFFDQTCFSEVAEGTQGQRVKLIVNSLTGVSEVAGWIENDLDRKGSEAAGLPRYMFRLPSFASAEDEHSDVIDASQLIDNIGQAGATPVRQAFLIFAEGPAGRLVSGSQYKVAAAALYGRTAQSAIESVQSNTRLNIGSLGASSIRIDVDGIREYLSKRVEHDLVRRFADADEGGTRNGEELADAIADAILLPLLIDPEGERHEQAVDDGAAKDQPQLLSRFRQVLLKRLRGRVKNFVDDLEDLPTDDYEAGVKALKSSITKGGTLEADVRSALGDSIRHVYGEAFVPKGGADDGFLLTYLRTALKTALPNPFRNGRGGSASVLEGDMVDAHVWSFALAQLVLDRIASRVGEVEARFDALASASTIADPVEGIRKRSGRAMLVMGKRFNEDEKESIQSELENYLLAEGWEAVGRMLANWVDLMRRAASAWRANLDDARERALRHARSLERRVDEERTDDCFTVERDFRRAERETPTFGTHDPERFLQPYAPDEKLREWIQELLGQRDGRLEEALTDIAQFVLSEAYSLGAGGRQDEEHRRRMRRTLGEKLKGFGSKVVVPAAFLHRHFRLAGVAEHLVEAWAKRIDRAASNPRAQENLRRRFLRTFGFPLDVQDGECVIPPKKEIIEKMALRLGQNCRSQCMRRVGPGADSAFKVNTEVFLPTDSSLVQGEQNAKEMRQSLAERAKASGSDKLNFHVECEAPEDAVEEVDGQRGNPFLMLAAVTEEMNVGGDDIAPTDGGAVHAAFSQISSLDYWKAGNDPHVKTYLDWIEDPSGRSMFADVSYSFGLGYTLPAFVTNERLRKSRWRPWAQAADRRMERESTAVADAIVYALLGTTGTKSALFSLGVGDADGGRTAWSLPLIAFGASKEAKNAFTFTRAAFTNETGQWRAKGRAFRDGDSETSIKKLFARLNEDPDARRQIAAEAAHFFGALAFEEGLRDEDVKNQFEAVRDWVHDHLRAQLKSLPNYALDYEDLVEQLDVRSMALSKLGRTELAAVFGN